MFSKRQGLKFRAKEQILAPSQNWQHLETEVGRSFFVTEVLSVFIQFQQIHFDTLSGCYPELSDMPLEVEKNIVITHKVPITNLKTIFFCDKDRVLVKISYSTELACTNNNYYNIRNQK